MIDMNTIVRSRGRHLVLCLSLALNFAQADAPATPIYRESKPTEACATCTAFDTELFNLLINRNSIIDGKNHFNKSFSNSFDLLLSGSKLSTPKENSASLRKRLLSGPAPKPIYISDVVTGKQYIYYEACQAHACDETNLALLYEPLSKAMRARLFANNQYEFLGNVSQQEMQLLIHLKLKQ